MAKKIVKTPEVKPIEVKVNPNKERIEKAIDKGTGNSIRAKVSIDDELAALRDQLTAISTANKISFTPKFQALVDVVENEVQKGKDMKTAKEDKLQS